MKTPGKITTEIMESAGVGNLSALRAVPKSDLHAHIMLSAPFKKFKLIAGDLIPEPPITFESFQKFDEYLFKHLLPHLISLENTSVILRSALEHMISDGVRVAEVSFDVSIAPRMKLSWGRVAETFLKIIEQYADRISVRPELGFSRGTTLEDWRRYALEALETKFFSGIDLYGDERVRKAQDFSGLFSDAKSRGLRIKLHAGEHNNPNQMYEEVVAIEPDAIQHGLAAASHSKLMKILIDNNIPLHLCPQSNIALKVTANHTVHPIRALFDRGVTVTLNSDDYTIFGTSVSQEYLNLYLHKVFSADELEAIRQTGLSVGET